jgi:Putative zinc finger motif, C2HC5-type
MPPSTPWTSQRSKGHVVSDRIQSPSAGSKTAAQKQTSSKHQSPEVNRLQKLISYLQNPASLPKSESEEGCFCLAQVHKISLYAPLCISCGLILCDLNQPYRACPFNSCGQTLLAPQARAALITTLGEKIAITIAEEENMRRKEEEDRRRAAGAFPQLGPGSSSPMPTKPISSAPHKILSLTQKGAILTTVRKTPTPPPTRPFKVDTTVPVSRIPPPPQEAVRFPVMDMKGDWQSVRSTRMVYVPLPQAEQSGSKISKKARRRQHQAASEINELGE